MDSPNLSPLKGFNSFKKAYEISAHARLGPVLLFISSRNNDLLIKGKVPEEDTIYFGISVPKKIFKKAVVRNRIKRLIRESLWKNIPLLANQFNLQSVCTILVNYKGEKITKTNQIHLSEIDKILSQALLKFCKANLPKKMQEL
ncbi:MAG: ribonuclease P protein component [Ignavibacteria bacterium GWF2_33_9]|nr:MAG: ribonuclease P protein component [Ignavibacteria bacterium GWF2_33_9]